MVVAAIAFAMLAYTLVDNGVLCERNAYEVCLARCGKMKTYMPQSFYYRCLTNCHTNYGR